MTTKKMFRFFTLFGLFPIYYEDGQFKRIEKVCVYTRIIWFLWHLAGVGCILFVYLTAIDDTTNTIKERTVYNEPIAANFRTTDLVSTIISSTDSDDKPTNLDKRKLNYYLISGIGVLMFILVDPVQTIILKRTFNFMPKILKEIQHLESINLGNQSSQRNFHLSKIGLNKKNKKELKNSKISSTESTTNICISDEPESKYITHQDLNLYDEDKGTIEQFSKRYNMLRYMILGILILTFVIVFVTGLFYALWPKTDSVRHDIKDEWKFFGSIFYLVFPCLTTWFCVFFIAYQRKMYQVLNELPDDTFIDEDYIKNIGDYFETMQRISKMLVEKIYRFTFGINFALFIIIGTMSTFELIQGLGEIQKDDLNTEFGDIIYVFPIAICIFHLFISCEHSTNLMTGQRDKLRYKLKGIMTPLIVDRLEISKENEKKFKRVEALYKNLKDFRPQAEVYGGFKVDFKLFIGMLFFMFTYARIFYKYNPGEAEI